jgi:hypothetical protein
MWLSMTNFKGNELGVSCICGPLFFSEQQRRSIQPWFDTAQICVHMVQLSYPKATAFPTHQTWYDCGWDPSEIWGLHAPIWDLDKSLLRFW